MSANHWNQIRLYVAIIAIIFMVGLFTVASRGQTATSQLSILNAEVTKTTTQLKVIVKNNCLASQKSAHLNIELQEDLIAIDTSNGDAADKELAAVRLAAIHELERQIPTCDGL